MEIWVGVVGTLLGGILGGLLTHWTAQDQAKREMRWQLVRLTQDKLEELARALDSLAKSYRQISGDCLISIQIGREIKIKEYDIPISQLNILTRFYASNLQQEKLELDKSIEAFGSIIVELAFPKERSKSEKQIISGKVLKAAHNIEKHCESMIDKAADVSRSQVLRETLNKSWKLDRG